MKRNIIIVFVIFLTTIACNESKKKREPIEKEVINIRQEWFPSACYSGDILASKLSEQNDLISIKVQSGSEDLDPIKMILSGDSEIGVSSLDRVVEANNKGADLIAIGVVNHISPTCFITLEKNKFENMSDFKEYKVGVFTGNNTEMIYELLLKKDGIKRDEINEIEASWDLNSFINSTYEVRPAFVYDELVSLDAQNVKYNILTPSDFGVSFIGPVYFVKKSFFNENKETLKNTLALLKEGWKNSLNNPTNAIDQLKIFSPDIDKNREVKSLEKGAFYFQGEDKKPLWVSKRTINKMGEHLVELGIIKESININNSIDLTLLDYAE